MSTGRIVPTGDRVAALIGAGLSCAAIARELGLTKSTVSCGPRHDAVRRGAVTPRPKAMPIEQLIAGRRNRNHLKQRLVAAGPLTPGCDQCGLVEWRGRPLSPCLHHINGVGRDNRLENLQLLCPNCHSQTESFGGRKKRGAAE